MIENIVYKNSVAKIDIYTHSVKNKSNTLGFSVFFQNIYNLNLIYIFCFCQTQRSLLLCEPTGRINTWASPEEGQHGAFAPPLEF